MGVKGGVIYGVGGSYSANVWFPAGVDAHVHLHLAFVFEALLADVAGDGKFTGVTAHVYRYVVSLKCENFYVATRITKQIHF